MAIFSKTKAETELITGEKVIAAHEVGKDGEVTQLLENDMAILEKIDLIYQRIDGMEKSNKKFFMVTTGNRIEQLENQIVNMKRGMIELLDQIDFLMSAVAVSGAEDLQKGMMPYYGKVFEIASKLGVEEIPFKENTLFNAKEQECVEQVFMDGYEDDYVVELVRRGYRDKESGQILRYMKVTVNKVMK